MCLTSTMAALILHITVSMICTHYIRVINTSLIMSLVYE